METRTLTIKTKEGKIEYVAQIGKSTFDKVGRKKGFIATETSPQYESIKRVSSWINERIKQ